MKVVPLESFNHLELQVGAVVKIVVTAGFNRQLLREVVDALEGSL